MPKNELMVDHTNVVKRKKTSRIIALVVLVVVCLISVLVIVGACVPVNLKPNLISSPSSIVIHDGDNIVGQFSSGEEKHEEFLKEFDQIFETNYLVALFSGRLGDYTISNQAEAPTWTSVQNELKKGKYVEFNYRDEQALRYNDGRLCSNIYLTSSTLTFSSVCFALSESDAVEELKMYVKVKFSNKTNATEYAVTISQKANTYSLFNQFDNFKTN